MPSIASKQIATICIVAATAISANNAHGQTAWYQAFEGPDTSWRDAGGNARYRIERHQRSQGDAHTGDGCEWLRLSGDNGTYVHLRHDVGRPRVIEELLPTVWIKSDRPGMQMAARVVLPRSTDPRTGRPVSTLVQGSSYTDVGRWQQLRIDDIPQLLARRVRAIRTELGPNLDGREAYVDGIVLNVYGGPGVTNVWIDDLDIAGYVAGASAGGSDTRSTHAMDTAMRRPEAGTGRAGEVVDNRARQDQPRLVGSVLMIEGRPAFPRIIQYQGEPLALLKHLGFNAVWLAQPASAELLAEADRLGLWLVCPPPQPTGPGLSNEPVAPSASIGPEYDRVLAWDLGRRLSTDRIESTRHWAEQIRSADRQRGRPLICQARSDLRTYSRHVDLLLIDRQPLGSSLELVDWADWIRRRPRLARPGTPVWTTIQTQPSASLRGQLIALQPNMTPPRAVSSEQIGLLAYTAIGSGARGLLFASQSPLDGPDPETRHRAMTLELLNLKMQLIEPWAAAGNVQATAETTVPSVAAAALRTDRARLLLPVWSATAAQWVPGQSATNGLSLVVPGVPESCNAYHLLPGGLRPLRHKRVTGGMRVTLDEFGVIGQVLMAQDPLVINSLSRRAAAIGARAAELQRHLAVRKLHLVSQVAEPSSGQSPGGQAAKLLADARKALQWSDGYLASRDYPAAHLHARRAMRSLRLIERAHWESATAGLDSPLSIPPAVSFDTLPWYHMWVDLIRGSRLLANRLAGGEFEDLPTMIAAGWQHCQHQAAGIRTAANLMPAAAHSGFSGLRLTARAEDPENQPAAVETPPVWITSPNIDVELGELICIHGWARVSGEIAGSVDGLMIVDSLGGEDLAVRIRRTDGWRQFTIYRAAPASGRMNLSFVLSGLAEVDLDDVAIQTLETAGTGRVTQAGLVPESRDR